MARHEDWTAVPVSTVLSRGAPVWVSEVRIAIPRSAGADSQQVAPELPPHRRQRVVDRRSECGRPRPVDEDASVGHLGALLGATVAAVLNALLRFEAPAVDASQQ